jgi:hypothetical protein
MANRPKEDLDAPLNAAPAARPGGREFNRGQSPFPDSSGDPFIDDMMDVANDVVHDGNAQINSPQEASDGEGSPGTSR